MKTSMKKKFKQTLAMLFAVAMVFTSIPQTAYAAEANNVETTETVEATEVVETAEVESSAVEVVEATEAAEVVEIEEGVDLGETGDTWAVTFVNDESVTVTENAENATEGTDYTFKAVANEGYENVTVAAYTTATYTADEKTTVEVTGPAEDVYTIAGSALTEAITIVVSATAQTPQTTYYSVTESVAEGASIAYVDNCVAEGKIAENTDLKFTVAVTDAENKEVKAVTYKVGEGEAAEVTDSEGVYTVAKENIKGDVTITVELQAKETAPATYTVTFAEVTGAAITEVKVGEESKELADNALAGLAKDSVVSFKVSVTDDTKEVDTVTVKVGEADATALTATDDVYSYTVAEGNATITVTLKDKEAAPATYTVTFTAETGAAITEVKVGEESKELENNALAGLADGSVVNFKVSVTDDTKEIDKVQVMSDGAEDYTELTATEGVYTHKIVGANATITVSLKDKVPTYVVSFAKAEGASVSDVTVAGVPAEPAEDGTIANVAENSVVTFKVNAEVTHKVTAVKAGDATITPDDAGVYSVAVTDNVAISIETEEYNKVTLDLAGDAGTYGAAVDGLGEYEPGDVIYTDADSVTINLVSARNYQIDKVELDGVEQTETAEGGESQPVKSLTVSFTDEAKAHVVKVTTSVLKREADAKIVFANSADNMTYAVTVNDYVKKTAGKSNTYDVFKGADYVKFTVTASGAYEPVVELNDDEVIGEKGATSKGKTTYTYKVVANALATDNTITINETIADQTVTVSYTEGEVLLGAASINGVKTTIDPVTENGIVTATFKVPYGSTITMTAAANDNCKLTKAVTTVGTKAKNEKIKNNQVTFSVKATADANTVITSEKLYTIGVTDGKLDLMTPVKGIYNVEWINSADPTALVGVRYGTNDMAAITAVDIKDNNKKSKDPIVSTFVISGEGGTMAALSLDKADAGKTLVATVKFADTTGAEKSLSVKFKVAPLATKVTVKGVNKGVLSQAADTTKEYALTFNPKGVSDIYEAEVTPADAGVTAKIEGGKLVVTTPQTLGEKVALVKIYNKAASTETEKAYITGDFNVTVTDPIKNVKPTVKLKSSNDVELTLTLGAKNVAEPNTGKVYYKVDVTSADKDEAVQNAIVNPFYFEKDGNSQEATVKVNAADFGEVRKSVKYNVTVTLVQTTNSELPGENNVAFTSKTGSKNNLATKAAYYETKLKLKKGKTTVYTGQYTGDNDVVVATAQFSKNTTYTTLASASVSPNYVEDPERITVRVEGNQILADVPAGTYPGKYTITAVATAPENTVPAKATITVNVLQSIADITVDVSSDKVYKQNNKAATISAKAYFNNDAWRQPKSKKVTWSIVKEDGITPLEPGDSLYGKISVKNGKVTIAKNYVVSDKEIENQFKVRATAADWKGNTVSNVSDTITIKASTVSLGEVILIAAGDDDTWDVVARSGETLTTEQIADMAPNGLGAVVLKKGAIEKDSYTGNELIEAAVATTDVTFSASNKAVSMSTDGQIYSVQKAVKNVKITATTTDGSKKKAVLSNLTVTYPEVNDLCLFVDGATATDATKPTELTYSVNANEEVYLSIYDNVDGQCAWFDGAVNHTLKVKKGGKLTFSYPGEGYYWFVPTAKVTTIELTDKTNNVKKTYTLTNTNWQEAAAPAVTTSDKLYAGYYRAAQTVTFAVADDYDYKGKAVRISYDPVESKKNSKYREFVAQSLSFEEKIIDLDAASFSLAWGTNYTNLTKGNYKLYFTFGTTEVVNGETVFKAETKTAAVTVKVENPKIAKSTFKPTTSYKMYVKDGLAVELTGTGKGIDMDTLKFFGLQNVNVNGQANKFTSYFELIDNRYIALKDGVNVDDITANDLKAMVSYDVYGDSPATYGCWGTVQIKITLEKAKTSQSYALTNLTVSGNTVSGNTVSGNVVDSNTVSGNTVSGNVFAYVGGKVENKVDVSEVYSESDKFDVSVGEDGTLFLVNTAVLEYKTYTVEAYIVTDDNLFGYKISQMKQAYLNAEDADTKAELKAAYEKAIKTHGVKVKTKVTINKASN